MERHILRCWKADCPRTFVTFTDLSNHHYDVHRRPDPTGPVEPWAPGPRQQGWEESLKVQAMQEWYPNGKAG